VRIDLLLNPREKAVHPSYTDRPMYTGAPMFGFAPPFAGPMTGHAHPAAPHGFCHSCCHPVSQCQCHRRECRKEARELLVNAAAASDTGTGVAAGAATVGNGTLNLLRSRAAVMTNATTLENAVINRKDAATATAFIGGGCCVHLSVEYIANDPTQASAVEILVADSEGTLLGWGRLEAAGTPYRIKEDIITTKPGAKLAVTAVNATARVRWCEIFIC
jgi:hypothetical protein